MNILIITNFSKLWLGLLIISQISIAFLPTTHINKTIAFALVIRIKDQLGNWLISEHPIMIDNLNIDIDIYQQWFNNNNNWYLPIT